MAANRPLLARSKGPEEARADCRDYCLAFRDRRAALRRWRGRELLRIGLRDLVMEVSPHEITAEIATLAGAYLDLSVSEIRDELRPGSDQIAFGVIALGKFGGVEMHYGSDCDVVFVYQNASGGAEVATLFAEKLIAWCGERTVDGPGFPLDARLRPYGASGSLASPLGAFEEYFDGPKSGFAAWERQALTRARFAAGDGATGARFIALARGAAFPEAWRPEWSEELKHIKSRVENERAGKGAFKQETFDLKLGPGGLSDIEWSAQWLAMKHGTRFPALQTPNTLWQLGAARNAMLLSEGEFQTLENAYTWLRRAELRWQIAREGALSGVKRGGEDAKVWARALFPGMENEAAMIRFEDEWKTQTQGARAVFERVRDGV